MHLSQHRECTTPRVNHNVNYEPCVIMMSQCRFIIHKNFTTLVSDVNNGGGYACVVTRII